jgi:hypothetical protein
MNTLFIQQAPSGDLVSGSAIYDVKPKNGRWKGVGVPEISAFTVVESGVIATSTKVTLAVTYKPTGAAANVVLTSGANDSGFTVGNLTKARAVTVLNRLFPQLGKFELSGTAIKLTSHFLDSVSAVTVTYAA